jgi:hypothetical protein
MPIRINLLAEAQLAEEMRRKDPVKRAVWIGGFVVFVALLCAATLQFKIIVARSEVSGLQSSWKAIGKQVKDVNDHRTRARDLEKKLAALDQFTTNRVLWATALNALQNIPLDGVQLFHVRADQTFTYNEGSKPVLPDGPVKHATVSEHVVVTLEGRDFSPRPGEQVPRFKKSLAASPYFSSILQKTNTIQLTSQTAPLSEYGQSFVNFGLRLYFEDKERRLYE